MFCGANDFGSNVVEVSSLDDVISLKINSLKNEMEIKNCTPEDLGMMLDFYRAAIEFQKKVSEQHWLTFDRELVLQEILESRQWKVLVGDEIGCIFLSTFSDPFIWGERDALPSIYLHRITINPAFRGSGFVPRIIEWAKTFGKQNGRQQLRLDTWGDNLKLIEFYQNCGFQFLGIEKPADPSKLPPHYADIWLAFFELEI